MSHPAYATEKIGPGHVEGNRALTQKAVRLVKRTGWLSVHSPDEGSLLVVADEQGRPVAKATLPLPEPRELPAGRYGLLALKAGC